MQTVAIQDAPQLLNTNDQAMWVLGYNEAVRKMQSRDCTESEQHMQELRAYELTVRNLRAELESLRKGQCLHKIAEPAAPLVGQQEVDLPDVDDMAHSALEEALSFGLSHDVLHRWMQKVMRLTQEALATHPTPQGLEQDAARYLALVETGVFCASKTSRGIWGLRLSGKPAPKSELDAAVDAAIAAKQVSGWLAKFGSPIECYYRAGQSLCENFTTSAHELLTPEPSQARYACPVCSRELKREAAIAAQAKQGGA
ncbi:hypothetical protein [Comamonas sp. NoAH]|uniref:hypothetical protein n=1 Tax=Comamonas halotolerans TaxID=3041496 RepID=UPI0024E150E1|nr:hypothetical protein [Comamonas sp. NoAH]